MTKKSLIVNTGRKRKLPTCPPKPEQGKRYENKREVFIN